MVAILYYLECIKGENTSILRRDAGLPSNIFKIFITLIYCTCVYMCTCVYKSEDNLQGLVLFFYQVGPGLELRF